MAITELRVEGLRTLADVRLGLGELTVIIGNNGSGKSSLIEACELLRKAPTPDFIKEFRRTHWGFSGLLRQGASQLKLGVRIQEADEVFDYEFALADRAGSVAITEEKLTTGPSAQPNKEKVIWHRTESLVKMLRLDLDQYIELSGPQAAMISAANRLIINQAGNSENIERLVPQFPDLIPAGLIFQILRKVSRALQSIEVHLPFEVLPLWGSRSFKRNSALRDDNLLEPVERLEPLGTNLANVYYALRNEYGDAHWRETLELVRLGLGDEVDDIRVVASPEGGKVTLRVKYRSLLQPIPSFALSDGTLAYLAWVAVYRVNRPTKPALLAIDEPELHLHPQLLMRVLDFLQSLGRESPVLLATHSDRLLDALPRPAQQAVLCELGPAQATKLWRPEAATLARWLERYRGLGELRSEGHDASVWSRDDEPAERP